VPLSSLFSRLNFTNHYSIAQGIADSLVLLASLRPRSTKDTSSLVPPLEVLRKLHRSLPTEPSEGWFGTLPPSNLTALRDDTTLQIKAGVTIPIGTLSGAGSSTLPSPAMSTGTTPTAAIKSTAQTNYANFPYPNYGGNQYRGAYAYTPSCAGTSAVSPDLHRPAAAVQQLRLVVQLSTTPSSGAAANDAIVASRFVRVILQLATDATTANRATRGSEYCHDGQGRKLDSDPNATATSSSWGSNAAPGFSDPSGAGKLLLSWISATYWRTLTLWIVIPIINLFTTFLCPLDVTVQGLSFLLFILMAHSLWPCVGGCTVIETSYSIRNCPRKPLSTHEIYGYSLSVHDILEGKLKKLGMSDAVYDFPTTEPASCLDGW
jgi:hypothetical protein